jgi:exopolysaccharide biosynthesis WecB/TagA/CpsF family protein
MQDFAGGGVERMRLVLANAFADQGHRVFLVVAKARGALATSKLPKGVHLVDLDALDSLSAITRLRRFVAKYQPHVLISSLDHNNIIALLACIGLGTRTRTRTRTRVVICQHNALSQEAVLGWKYRIIPALYWLLQWRADGIVAVSAGVADDLARVARLARNRITVVHNPVVDTVRLPRPSEPPPHAWFVQPDYPVFVFVGRLVSQKDPIFLLRAFARRLAYGPARLVILGEGPLAPDMVRFIAEEHLSDHVLMVGYITDPLPWIAAATALLLPSRYEGFGNVIAEALACGTPVVATNCRYGPAEILEGGTFGRLVEPGELDAFASAMQGDLQAQFPAAQLRERGLCFAVTQSVRGYAGLIERILQPRSRHLFGLSVSTLELPKIVQHILAGPSGKLRLVVTPNANHVRLLREHAFFHACRAADIVCADGWPVSLYARLRGASRAGRVTGCDILHSLFEAPSLRNRDVFVVAESAATEIALQRWLATRPWTGRWEIQVAPPNLLQDLPGQIALAARIFEAKPDLLIMTLGAPVSELFVHQHTAALPPLWALCIGQALRAELGLVRRSPKLLRQAGLEWAWRCWQEPLRLGVRYLKDGAWFPWAVMRDLARRGDA